MVIEMEKLLKVRNLTKKYHEGGIESRAVDGVNLDVGEQEFVVVMGASGSGKTSLLHLLAGIDNCDEGTIHYKDVDFSHMSEKAKTLFRRTNIGIVFQQYCLIPDLTVYENILLPAMLERKQKQVKETVLKLCGQVGLENHIKKYPSQLSGGQQQRAAILRAVVNKPALLFCDEPTGSLNSAQAETVMKLLKGLNKKGQTIVLVTHDIKVAVKGQRVIYMKDGKVSGEFRFSGTGQREEELMSFLQKKGW